MSRVLLGVIGLLAVIAIGAVVHGQFLLARIDTLEGELRLAGLQRGACKNRNQKLLEDKESDDAVDRIPDDGLRHVPDRWMLPASP